jgi:hypothetical protein
MGNIFLFPLESHETVNRQEYDIEMDLRKIEYEDMNWIELI